MGRKSAGQLAARIRARAARNTLFDFRAIGLCIGFVFSRMFKPPVNPASKKLRLIASKKRKGDFKDRWTRIDATATPKRAGTLCAQQKHGAVDSLPPESGVPVASGVG